MDPEQHVPAVEPILLTRRQAAIALAVGEDLVSRLILEGRLHGVRLGRRWRIPRSAIDALIMGSPMPNAGPVERR